jgi:hypothetical protein
MDIIYKKKVPKQCLVKESKSMIAVQLNINLSINKCVYFSKVVKFLDVCIQITFKLYLLNTFNL